MINNKLPKINNRKDICKYIKDYFPNFILNKNNEFDLINYTLYPKNNINNANYTGAFKNDYIQKYWIKNKNNIIKYYNSKYKEKSDENLLNAIYNNYHYNNLLYFETLLISLTDKYKSKNVLDVFYTTNKRIVGCLIKNINYTLLLNNKDIKKNIKKLYIKNLKNKDNKYVFKKSLKVITKKYSLIFIDTQSNKYKKPEISKYMKYLKSNGVLVYSYYKKINELINKKYIHEIINFNNQKLVVYLNKKPKQQKGKYTYLLLSTYVNGLEEYLNKDWKPLYKYSDNVDLLYIDGRYNSYKPLYDIKCKYKSMIDVSSKFNFLNKGLFHDYVENNNKSIYKKYFMEQYNINKSSSWDNIKKIFKKNKYWIVKPEIGAAGFGIRVFKDFDKMKKYITDFKQDFKYSASKKKDDNKWVMQKYIDNPLLIHNKKFHIRIFYLISIIDGKLKCYFFKKGLLYLSEKEYTLNNLSFNIHNSHGKSTNEDETGLFPDKISKLFGKDKSEKINKDMINIFNYISSQIEIKCFSESKNCFKIVGADIMINDKFETKIIEINSDPGLLTGIWFMDIKNIFYQDLFDVLLNNKKSDYYIECNINNNSKNNNNNIKNNKKNNNIKTFFIKSRFLKIKDFEDNLPDNWKYENKNKNIDLFYVDDTYRRDPSTYSIIAKCKSLLKFDMNYDNKMTLFNAVKEDNIKIFNKYFLDYYITNKSNTNSIKKHFNNKDKWILKPAIAQSGFGIEIFNNYDNIKKYISNFKLKFKNEVSVNNWVLQKYIDNPLLYDGRKFHMRVNFIVGLFDGKIRTKLMDSYSMILAEEKYKSNNFKNKKVHNTHFTTHDNVKRFPNDFKLEYGITKMKKIKKQIEDVYEYFSKILKYKCYPENKNCFQILGMDIMITDKFEIKCIELNIAVGLAMKNKKRKDIFINQILNYLQIKSNNNKNNTINNNKINYNNIKSNLNLYNINNNIKSDIDLIKLRDEYNNIKELNIKNNNLKYLFYNVNTNEKIYKYLYSNYKVILPVYTILDWCNIYEILYKCKIKYYPIDSTFIHLCSNEESSGYALDFYYYNIFNNKQELINNKVLNINNKLDTLKKIDNFKKKNKTDIIIYNCSLNYSLEKDDKYKLNFEYHLNIKDCNLYSVQFNYIDDKTNIITLYYNRSSIEFHNKKKREIFNKTLSYSFLINRENKNHKYKYHKKENPLDWHTHKKINIKDEKKFIKNIFNFFGIDKEYIKHLFDSKKKYLNNYKEIIKYKNKSYSELINNNNNKERNKINNNNIKNYKFILSSIILCNKGGTVIFKYSLPIYSNFDIKMIYLLYSNFNEIQFICPTFSYYFNYFYIICKDYKGYKKNIKDIDIIKLYNDLNNKIEINKLLLDLKLESKFKNNINNIINKITKQKIKNIKIKNKYIIENKELNKNKIEKIFIKNIENWFSKNNIKKRNKPLDLNKIRKEYINKHKK